MKEKNLLPRYKLSDRTVVLLADIVEKSVCSTAAKEPKNRNAANMNAFFHLNAADIPRISAPIGSETETVSEIPNQKTERLKQNAAQLFHQMKKFHPYSLQDLLQAHQILWNGVMIPAGSFRTGAASRSEGKKFSYTTPAAKRIPDFVKTLFTWGEKGKKHPAHPLIQAAVMGYGLEVIQPFAMGNRGMSLFWQMVVLHAWKPGFDAESMLPAVAVQRQDSYEQALKDAVREENAVGFIEFMLECYQDAWTNRTAAEPVREPAGEPVQALLAVLGEHTLSTKEMMEGLHLKHRPSFRDHYLLPALQSGLVEMTIPDKPNSCRQKYRRRTSSN